MGMNRAEAEETGNNRENGKANSGSGMGPDTIAYIPVLSWEVPVAGLPRSGRLQSQDEEDRLEILSFVHQMGFVLGNIVDELIGTPEEIAPENGGPVDSLSRPGIQRLLELAGHGPCKRVLVCDRGRFFAPEPDLATLLLHFWSQGVQVLETRTGTDLTEDQSQLQAIVDHAQPEQRELARRRLTTAKWRASKKRNGKKCGPKPFGEIPGEKDTLRRIWKLRRKPPGKPRMSYRKIAAILNTEGWPTQSGRPWQGRTIQAIIARTRRFLLKRDKPRPHWSRPGYLNGD